MARARSMISKFKRASVYKNASLLFSFFGRCRRFVRSNGKCSKRLVGPSRRVSSLYRSFFSFRQLQSLDHHRCGRRRYCAPDRSHHHLLRLPEMQTPFDSKVRRGEASKIDTPVTDFSGKNGVRIDSSSSSTNKRLNEKRRQRPGEFLLRYQIELQPFVFLICRTADRANMADQLRMKYGKDDFSLPLVLSNVFSFLQVF